MSSHMQQVQQEVSSWDGVTESPHRFGGVEFKLANAEVGHIHQNGLVDIPFPMKIRNQLVLEGLVSKHHVLTNSGWISFRVRSENDVPHAIWLLKLSYLRYVLKRNNQAKMETNGNKELRALNLSDELITVFEKAIGASKRNNPFK